MSPMKCPVHFGAVSFGLTIEKIRTEIQLITSSRRDLEAVFGFGSFFRAEQYNDIDLLAVAVPQCESGLQTYYEVNTALINVGIRLRVRFDITFLTYNEFLEGPLLEMHSLTPLYFRDISAR